MKLSGSLNSSQSVLAILGLSAIIVVVVVAFSLRVSLIKGFIPHASQNFSRYCS